MAHAMAFSLTQTAISMINGAGYGGLTLGLIIDSAGIPVPSEILLPLAAVAAQQGRFNLGAVIVIGAVAQTVGGIIAYEIGRRGGVPLIHRYGKYVLISNRDLDYTHRQFERHGQWLAFFGRCLPLIRGYVGFVAGIAVMPFRRFVIATFLGSLVWTLVWVAIGTVVAGNVDAIDSATKPLTYAMAALIIIAVGFFVRHRIKEPAA